MKYILFIAMNLFFGILYAQKPMNTFQKVAPSLQNVLEKSSAGEQLYTVAVTDLDTFHAFLQHQNIPATIVHTYAPARIALVRTTTIILFHYILPAESVLFADFSDRKPVEELALTGFDLNLNKINLVHHQFPHLNGEGLTASIKENRLDETDIDLQNRYVAAPESPRLTATHATTMATILAGAGNSYHTGKGAAWASQFTSSNFANLLPDSNYQKLNISVQNHSYGVGIENYYGAEAVAYDASVIEQSELLHVFSAGNRGNQTSESGIYKSLKNIANLTGTFKMAKNGLVVGAQDTLGAVAQLSSKGPAYDGRVKPELVALGQDGSSGAAALTSGVAILLQQAHLEQVGELPSAALVKAILINSADDVASQGIDFQSGYGSLNAWRAVQTMTEKRFLNGKVAQGEIQTFPLQIPEKARNVKITLVWSDVPASANAPQALVNDLDLELQKEEQTWLPWVLNTFANVDSLQQLPIRRKDRLNNVEQITLENPTFGVYNLSVSGFKIPAGAQDFYIAYQWDTVGHFQWTFPTKNDPVAASSNAILRWETTFSDTNATLEYTLDGLNWQPISTSINLQKGSFHWQTPTSFSKAMVRIRKENQQFISDTFIISKPLDIEIGFNCEAELLLYWNKMPGAKSYELYRLDEKYLVPIAILTDTFAVLNKVQNKSFWYAVAPLTAEGRAAFKSYATNYTLQGVGCYAKNFIADLVEDAAQLTLSLGTTFNVKNITFEKQVRANFIPIQKFTLINKFDLQAIDNNLQTGINRYRAKIELLNETVVYTNVAEVYFAGDDGFFIFPNPVQGGQDLSVLFKNIDGGEVRLFDALGREAHHLKPSSEVETLSIQHLAPGVYQAVFFDNGTFVKSSKVVIF